MNAISKRLLAVIPALVIAFLPAAAAAAQKVAVVKGSKHPVFEEIINGIKAIEGVEYLFYDLDDSKEKAETILAELKKSPLAAIVTVGPFAAETVAGNVEPIPVIITGVASPKSFVKEGAENVAMVALNPSPQDQVKALSQIIRPRKVGVIHAGSSEEMVEDLKQMFAKYKVILVSKKVDRASESEKGLAELNNQGVDALFMLPDKINLAKQSVDAMVKSAVKMKVPLYALTPGFVQNGALFTLSIDASSIGAEAANILQQILFERKPVKDVGFVTPRALKVLFNMETAKAIKLGDDAAFRAMEFCSDVGCLIMTIKGK